MASLKISTNPAVYSFLFSEELYPERSSPERNSPEPAQPPAANAAAAPPAGDQVFHYLGENRRFILVLVHYPEEKTLPEAEKAYLIKILSALKLGLEDVALLNYAHYSGRKYADLKDFFAFNHLLLFGVSPNLLQIPGPVLPYHLGLVEGNRIIASDSTEDVRPDAGKRKALWEELQKAFS